MITKQEIRTNYIEQISIKCDTTKIKYYQISKNYCKLPVNCMAMITKQQIRTNTIKRN